MFDVFMVDLQTEYWLLGLIIDCQKHNVTEFEMWQCFHNKFTRELTSLQIPHLRPAEYKRSRLSRNHRTVNRAYGGVLSGGAVRER